MIPKSLADLHLKNAWLISCETGLDSHIGARLHRNLMAENSLVSSKSVSALMAYGLSEAIAVRLITRAKDWEDTRRYCEAKEISMNYLDGPLYPGKLAAVDDPPSMLYSRGTLPADRVRSIAIVGTRKSSRYGLETAARLVKELEPFQPWIISGLAYGIDSAVHRACLLHGIPTAAVLAHGLDFIYPSVHSKLAQEMVAQGGTLISEFPPGTGAKPFLFPRRNRIVAGLTEAVLVVESPAEGGSLITAGIAASYHREVLAIPGHSDSSFSRGCHNMIRHNQAVLVTTGAEVAEILEWEAAPGKSTRSDLGLSPIQLEICLFCSSSAKTIDEIKYATNLSTSDLLAELVFLELKELIVRLEAQRFKCENPGLQIDVSQ